MLNRDSSWIKNDIGAPLIWLGVKAFKLSGVSKPGNHPSSKLVQAQMDLSYARTVERDTSMTSKAVSDAATPSILQLEYKEHYLRELQRRSELNDSISTPIGVIVILFGLLFYILTNAFNTTGLIFIIITIITVVSLCFLGGSVYFLVRFYYNHKYGYASTPAELLDWRRDLEKHYAIYGQKSQEELDKIVIDALFLKYAILSDTNFNTNNNRIGLLQKAKLFMILSIIPLLLAGFIAFVYDSADERPIYEIHFFR